MDFLNKIIDSKKIDYIKKNWDSDKKFKDNFWRFFNMEVINNNGLVLKQFAEILGAELPESIDHNAAVKRVLTQSVYVVPGDVVISAGWYPKVKTVSESLSKGALAVFCDLETKKQFPQDNVIGVEDPMDAVLKFENWRATDCNAIRITITGSVGKTTTTGLINSIIANSFKTLTHHTMSNSHGAILRNVQRLNKKHEYWVQEVGGVQPGYIESSAKFLQPDIVVLTNIGESHLNLYGTKDNILKDKGSLERYAKPDGVVIINSDDEILSNTNFSHRVITCSLKDKNADYYAYDLQTQEDGLHFTVSTHGEEAHVHLNLYGDYNAYNALFAIACGKLAGLDLEKIVSLMETYQPSGMRQNLVKIGGYSFFVDAFNAEPKTVLGSAETLQSMPVPDGGRRIFVTGHIDKLGEESARMHEDLGKELGKLNLDMIILFAGDSKYTYEGIKSVGYKNAILMQSREELDAWLTNNLTREDVVFFKSGQFEAALAKTVDHVFGTSFQNEQQFNEGTKYEEDGLVYRLRQDNIAEVEGYTGNRTEIVIPEMVKDHVVTRISPRAFTRKYEISSVFIPDTVTSIGREAFYICPKLRYLHLPRNLKIIDNNAFNYCRALEEVFIPVGTIHIGRHAFYDCAALTSVTIPNSVGFFGEDVFALGKPENRSLTVTCEQGSVALSYCGDHNIPVEIVDEIKATGYEVVLPEDIKAQIVSAFEVEEPASDVESEAVSLEDAFEKIKNSRPKDAIRALNTIIAQNANNSEGDKKKGATLDFDYEVDSTKVTVTAGGVECSDVSIPTEVEGKPVKSIGYAAFRDHQQLRSITFNGDMESVGNQAFYKCYNLGKVVFKGTVKNIERSSFNCVSALTVMVLPEGVETIGKLALAYNRRLRAVYIPDSVNQIDPDFIYKSPGAVICCNPGSYAEQFAKDNNLKYCTDFK